MSQVIFFYYITIVTTFYSNRKCSVQFLRRSHMRSIGQKGGEKVPLRTVDFPLSLLEPWHEGSSTVLNPEQLHRNYNLLIAIYFPSDPVQIYRNFELYEL